MDSQPSSFFPVPSEVIELISRLGGEIREIQTNGNGAGPDLDAALERLRRERNELIRLVEEKFRRWYEVEVKGGPQ